MEVEFRTAECRSLAEVHRVLRETLSLPDYYGENLDALWDCLTGEVTLPLSVVWLDFWPTYAHLGPDVVRLLRLFLEAEAALPAFQVLISRTA